MFTIGKNRIINFDSIIILLIVFFGLLALNDSGRNNNNELKPKPVATYISVTENSAVSTSFARLQIFQKTWISNKDNFNVLAFNRNPLSENKKVEILISRLKNISQGLLIFPHFTLPNHLLPALKDEPRLLS